MHDRISTGTFKRSIRANTKRNIRQISVSTMQQKGEPLKVFLKEERTRQRYATGKTIKKALSKVYSSRE